MANFFHKCDKQQFVAMIYGDKDISIDYLLGAEKDGVHTAAIARQEILVECVVDAILAAVAQERTIQAFNEIPSLVNAGSVEEIQQQVMDAFLKDETRGTRSLISQTDLDTYYREAAYYSATMERYDQQRRAARENGLAPPDEPDIPKPEHPAIAALRPSGRKTVTFAESGHKRTDRVMDKIRKNYNGDPRQLTDAFRVSVVIDGTPEMVDTIIRYLDAATRKALGSDHGAAVCLDYDWQMSGGLYPDRKFLMPIEHRDALFPAEVRFVEAQQERAYALSHRVYELMRRMEDDIKDGRERDLSEFELESYLKDFNNIMAAFADNPDYVTRTAMEFPEDMRNLAGRQTHLSILHQSIHAAAAKHSTLDFQALYVALAEDVLGKLPEKERIASSRLPSVPNELVDQYRPKTVERTV